MLLEWEIALARREKGNARLLLVLVGAVESASNQENLIRFQIPKSFDEFPNARHSHPASPRKQTIRQIMQNIFNLQGVHAWPTEYQHIRALAKEAYQRAKRELADGFKAALALDHTVAAALRHLQETLRPLGMEADRSRLRDAHQAGTRRWLVDSVLNWLRNEDSRLFWLKGDPGVGKSIVAAIVADALQGEWRLGTAFFCKHDDTDKRDAERLLHTLAYGLAEWNHNLALNLSRVLTKRSDVNTLPLEDQFRVLIREPLDSVHDPNGTVVFVVDALDELEVAATENQADADIYASSILEHWKTLPDFHQIKRNIFTMSGGLLIWLSNAAELLRGAVTEADLRVAIRDLPDDMDVLYERALQKAYNHNHNLPRVMECIVASVKPLSLPQVAGLLDLPVQIVRDAVHEVSNVLQLGETVTVKHKSVADFLTDPLRCKNGRMLVHLGDAHERMALACLRVMKLEMPPHIFVADKEQVRWAEVNVLEEGDEVSSFEGIKARLRDMMGMILELEKESFRVFDGAELDKPPGLTSDGVEDNALGETAGVVSDQEDPTHVLAEGTVESGKGSLDNTGSENSEMQKEDPFTLDQHRLTLSSHDLPSSSDSSSAPEMVPDVRTLQRTLHDRLAADLTNDALLDTALRRISVAASDTFDFAYAWLDFDFDLYVVPAGWERHVDELGQVRYIFLNTGSARAYNPGLEPSLPEGWERRLSKEGNSYYIDHNNRRSTWIHPNARPPVFADHLGLLPDGWECRHMKSRPWYIDHNTRTTTWLRPYQHIAHDPSEQLQYAFDHVLDHIESTQELGTIFSELCTLLNAHLQRLFDRMLATWVARVPYVDPPIYMDLLK
ncbi:hypothetical protein HDV00_005197 [Rhizophlyctis rosea]|nr:hypothetical protein HDV00_005197 [Rhizophlyctis rosea]